MERLKNITIIFLLAVGLLNSVALPICFANRSSGTKSASVLLQEGLYAEQIDGDLDAAIKIYEQIIKDSSAQRSHIAQAMYRQGMCYLKKQDEQQAKEVFGKLVANYSDQTKIVDKVKPMLDELGNADPAALMPPETLIYIETGSPGRQIETILNMLKGTPFENPLAALGGGKGPGPGGKSPGDMMAALMNPSMIAEFKKIRGMGIGVTGVAQNNPPVIAVLFPGKSDALRGLILAALGMAGTPGEPIEGMQTVTIAGTAGVAYDDNIVIIAQPAGQLSWSVKQYKGVTSKPTLASSNKSFAKVSKKERQENAITIWANVDEVFAGLSEIFPEGKIPGEVLIADGIADFKNIDDLIVFFNIQEDGIAFEKNIAFKDGHRCLAYNLIRTPNLSSAGFEAVPSEAVALLSIALGEAESAQASAASKSIESLTGLDIGREIFANIEQINLFALPPDSISSKVNKAIPAIANNLGLAVTSHNPQQTREILTQLLTVSNLIAGQSVSEQLEPGNGKYQIGLVNNQKLYCYMNQMNKTTVLSLNPDVVETSVSAIKRRRSVCTTGPLQEAVSKLSPATSKLVLVNVGGGIRLADAYLSATYNNPQNPAHKTLAKLAQACDKTSIQLRTDERINNFNSRVSIDQLPPLDSVFPLLMQLSQSDPTAKAKATKPEPRNGATTGLTSVSKLKWKAGVNAKSHKVYFGTKTDELSLLAEVQKPVYPELPELEEGVSYYWRVDEVWADGTVITGDVWSFTVGKLVGWWKLDETSGETAKDSAGNNDGRVVGDPQWQPSTGKIGGAMEFDGDGDYVEIGRESNFDITDQITVSAWIKVNKFDKEWQAVIAKGDSAWRIQRIQNNNSLEFACSGLKIPSGAPWGNLYGEKSVNDGQWHHIAGVYDGRKMYIYLDGTLDTSQIASGRINTNDEPVYIGENSENTGRHWNGLIDDLRIYNYALSPDEIKALGNVTATKPRPINRAVLGSTTKVELSWTPGIGAASHKVFFGTEPDELSLLGEVTSPPYTELPSLEKDTEYYWRIDKVQSNGAAVSGEPWSFTTSGKLIGWWKLDEVSGSIAEDSSGNSHSGTLQGDPVWQPAGGKVVGALEFDGDGDYVKIGQESDFDLTNQITIAAWIKAKQFDKERQAIVTKGGSAWRLHRNLNTNNIRFNITYGYQPSVIGKVNVNDGQWHHLVGTYDGIMLCLYVDGRLDNSVEVSKSIGANDKPVCIGGHSEQAERCWNGLIDDVRIYDYALSQNEVVGLL